MGSFDHEKLDVYQAAIKFVGLADGIVKGPRESEPKSRERDREGDRDRKSRGQLRCLQLHEVRRGHRLAGAHPGACALRKIGVLSRRKAQSAGRVREGRRPAPPGRARGEGPALAGLP